MNKYYLAIDIGASSGRHILAHLEGGKIVLEEIYRFSNGMVEADGEKIWDIDRLFLEVVNGIKKCGEANKIPSMIGIDTWAVDFVLLDENDNRVGNAVAYRDSRTKGMDKLLYDKVDEVKLYETTGIQKQQFNTIYQLMALRQKRPYDLEKAKTMLMIPDYLNFLLTGKKAQEYTNATTTQLVNPKTQNWDFDRIELLGFPKDIFLPISEPGQRLGSFSPQIKELVGFDSMVVLPATHDTGSAVVAVPGKEENVLYISSGTWSLMGTELDEANCSVEAMHDNFTNEGGFNKKYRFLKNIMGLWMIQSVKKEMADSMSFEQICKEAAASSIESIVDVNDDRFLAPNSMVKEVQKACEEAGMRVPNTIAEVAAVIYNSLAKCYKKTLLELEKQTGMHYETIHVVGGGANAKYLNQLTASATGRTVLAGPTEATAIGNIVVLMLTDGLFKDLSEAKSCIYDSFDIEVFEP